MSLIMKQIIFSNIIFLTFLLIACNGSSTKVTVKDSPNQITIIVSNAPCFKEELKLDMGGLMSKPRPDIFFQSTVKGELIPPIQKISNDTIRIKTQSKTILINHKYNIIGSYEYLANNGDTLLFSYNGEIPTAKIMNRKTLDFDLNFQLFAGGSSLDNNNFSSLILFNHPWVSIKIANGEIGKQIRDIKAHYYQKTLIDLRLENHLLDSLLLKKKISSNIHAFYKDRIQYDTLSLMLNDNRFSDQQLEQYIKNHNDSISTIVFSLYHSWIYNVASKYFNKKVRTIELGNGSIYNYKSVFDSICACPFLKSNLRDNLLFQNTMLIAENFSLNDFKTYFNKLEKATNDTARISQIRKKYFLNFSSERNEEKQMYLLSLNKQKFTMEDVVKKHKGKLIYVDFWASWCSPCRELFPYSQKRQAEFKDKNVVFIYLSIDKDFDQWQKAVKEEKMDYYPESYLVINPNSSLFFKELNIKAIPRYIMYDQAGQLAHKNAPSPKANELPNIIEKLLSKAK